jgi:hypothetical protein
MQLRNEAAKATYCIRNAFLMRRNDLAEVSNPSGFTGRP